MSRQTKDPVHKCHSDPGQQAAGAVAALARRNLGRSGLAAAVAGARHVPGLAAAPPATRKCVLTLDGYSYVIGESQRQGPSVNISAGVAGTRARRRSGLVAWG